MSHPPQLAKMKDIQEELEVLRRDRRLKDDTIKFLQKEKDSLLKEIKHYENLCREVEIDNTSRQQAEAEVNDLRLEIFTLKDIIRRQRIQVKSGTVPNSSPSDSQLPARICRNLKFLLQNMPTMESSTLLEQIDQHGDHLERANPRRAENSWSLLEITDRVLCELSSYQKRLSDLPSVRPTLRYAQSQGTGSETRYGSLNSEVLTVARKRMAATAPSGVRPFPPPQSVGKAPGHLSKPFPPEVRRNSYIPDGAQLRQARTSDGGPTRPDLESDIRPISAMSTVTVLDTLRRHPPGK